MKAVQRLTKIDHLRAVSHPLRQRILELLVMDALTTHQLARELSVPPGRLYHHVARLERMGLIRAVGHAQKRGAIERTYRATAREYTVDDRLLAASHRVSPPSRKPRGVLAGALASVFTNAATEVDTVLENGTLDERTMKTSVVFEKQRIRGSAAELRQLQRRLQAWLAAAERVNAKYGSSRASKATREYAIVVGFYPVS